MARRKPAPEPSLACVRCGQLVDPSRGAVNFCPACGASQAPGARGARRRGGRERDGVIADRYRLLELLGEGGMGRVYRAEHIRMGKALALKLLREDFAREPAAAERFLAEACAVSRLSHPHSIAVFDFGEVGPRGGLYLAMEYVPGEDLAAALRAQGALPEARARVLGQQILGSLAEAHEAGVIHRDVKPGNLMLMRTRTGEDFVKVLDFGIAALRDEVAGGGADAIVGTPAYLAPEQARGAAVDGRADLYALGCVLYELVAGRPPFVAPSPMAVVSAHLSQEPPPLPSVAPGVSRAFADVVHRALAKRPVDRFRSADAMREALLATAAPGGRRARPSRAAVERAGDAGLASRADFAALGKQVRALPGRAAPLVLAALVAAGAALAWRWDVAHGLLAARAPALAAALPRVLQPAIRADGGAPVPHPPGDANRLSGGAGGDPARVEGPEGDSRSEVRPAEAQVNEEAGDLSRTPERDPLADGVGAAALEQEAPGAGTRGEEEALGAIALAAPCSAEEIWARAEAFLARVPAPAPERAAAARVLAARAAEELSRASPDDPALRSRAVDAWRAVAAAGGPDAAAAQARGAALAGGDALAAGMPLCP
ncbi:MAG TPA: serine/threonine-protein kinase [Anaeromyxobacter sp.]|nr:serine/threonine-protein kinase [Anaeromyxobacter sp.]